MRADSVEVSWDANKNQWVTRIQIGDEVIRRHNKEAKDTNDQALRTAATQAVKDEGYEADPQAIAIKR